MQKQRKSPEFMIELHKIREGLTKKWKKMTSKEMLQSIHESGKWIKTQSRTSSIR
jgi:hypothetical protein